ncbi:sigma 54-interacting transcriptional regulator [Virgibacillus dokdonensis]|uniref:sigma 54-interacting transcriptional regulator n=1 Tax=Virgibacillus dokdonensis TaxID=302167 RepID=UPI0020C9735C|nr:sigma 54-interacting transcriptional regulator [Virgibacillus dokdonensis]
MKEDFFVEQWMDTKALSISPSTPLEVAFTTLCNHAITTIPVVAEGCMQGVVSSYDVWKYIKIKGQKELVASIMNKHYATAFIGSSMHDIYQTPAYVIDGNTEELLGQITAKELLAFQKYMHHELTQIDNLMHWYELIFDTAYEGLTVVDDQGVIQLFNQAYSRYVGVAKEEALGKKADDIIENTRLPVVLKTGIPERSQAHRLQGQNLVVHRIPIWKDNKIIGAAGILVYEGVSEIYEVIQKMDQLDKNTRVENATTVLESSTLEVVKFENILGDSKALTEAKKMARKAADSSAAVLLTGESGVGKEQFAKAIHDASAAKNGRFISVNCAAIPDGLMESELFGYAKGAFTGAHRDGKPGKFELAHDGTIFLDEIGDMPFNMQAKILRVLQEKKVERVGDRKAVGVNFRLITATNQNLQQMVKDGKFREDLYYRLYVIPIEIPPLRERLEDLPTLIAYQLQQLAKSYKQGEKTFDQHVLQWMKQHHWPGNVRELMNIIERLYVLTDGNHITFNHLPASVRETFFQTYYPYNHRKDELLEEATKQEKEMITQTLKQVQGNKTKAAEKLGMSRATLYNKLARYKLNNF